MTKRQRTLLAVCLAILAVMASAAVTLINLATQVQGILPLANGGTGFGSAMVLSVPNEGTTGTSLNLLAKLTGNPSTAIKAGTGDTAIPVLIVVSGNGTTGSALLASAGIANCTFDGATTANHFVLASTTTAGDCHDAGATAPTSGWVVGIVNSTNASGGTYQVSLVTDYNASSGGGVTTINGTANQIASSGTTTITLALANPLTLPGEITLAASTTGAASLNIPSGTPPTTPAQGDIFLSSNELDFVAQTSTNGGFIYYDSGGTNKRTDDTTGTITTHTIHHPLAAPTVASYEQTDTCGSATCTEKWQPAPTVLFVTADFTDASSTAFQAITGLSYTFPANLAVKAQFDCDIIYHQTVAAVADTWGVQDVTVAPTNIFATGFTQTAATTWAEQQLLTLATTTATAIGGTFTPSAITTDWHARIRLLVEHPSNASTSALNVMIKQATAADLIVIRRGSNCSVNFQ
jgi:hypothetical protein